MSSLDRVPQPIELRPNGDYEEFPVEDTHRIVKYPSSYGDKEASWRVAGQQKDDFDGKTMLRLERIDTDASHPEVCYVSEQDLERHTSATRRISQGVGKTATNAWTNAETGEVYVPEGNELPVSRKDIDAWMERTGGENTERP